VTRDHEPHAPTGRRPRHDVVADPVDVEVAQCTESHFYVIRQGRLVMALRRNGNEIGGLCQQVDHARRLRRPPAPAATVNPSPCPAPRAYRGPP
jgi:hypothetical protein